MSNFSKIYSVDDLPSDDNSASPFCGEDDVSLNEFFERNPHPGASDGASFSPSEITDKRNNDSAAQSQSPNASSNVDKDHIEPPYPACFPRVGAPSNLEIAAKYGRISGRVRGLAESDPEIGSLLATKFPEQYYDRAKYELPEVKSLLRIFDYCDNANMNSRESIDKLGKIFKEESAQNAFTAENWWTREKLKNYNVAALLQGRKWGNPSWRRSPLKPRHD